MGTLFQMFLCFFQQFLLIFANLSWEFKGPPSKRQPTPQENRAFLRDSGIMVVNTPCRMALFPGGVGPLQYSHHEIHGDRQPTPPGHVPLPQKKGV